MKILFLQKRPLFPANTGGKIRTLNVLRHLARWHDITYVCNVLKEEEPHLQEMTEIGLEVEAIPWQETKRDSAAFYWDLAKSFGSRYPYTVCKDYDSQVRSRAQQLLEQNGFDLLVCDFVQMARNVPESCSIPTVLFQHNVEAQIYRRMAETERNPIKRGFIRNQSRKMAAFEGTAGESFDRVIAVSEQDRETFRQSYGWHHVDVIGTAVDTEFFQPHTTVRKTPGRIVFVGSMDWSPNEEGVSKFVDRIWPEVSSRCPDTSFEIVGRNPPKRIKALSQRPRIRVTGTVEDVRPYIAAAEIAVVPIYAGGGTRLKIYEFMAMGTPVVSTSVGAEGLGLEPGTHLAIADTEATFAKAVVDLLNDQKRRTELSQAARDLVVKNYDSEAVARQFESICQTQLSGKP